MVNIGQVQKGIQRYLEMEIVAKMEGWQKWAFGVGAAMYMEQIPGIYAELSQSEMIKALKVIDDNGLIDLDKLHERFLREAEKGAVTFTVPIIGPLTLTKEDVTKIYQAIATA